MSEDMKRLHAIVRGRVQGVSYRYYTTLKARELGIAGWVYNRPDGAVELMAEGSTSALDTLEAWLHEGSPSAKVDNVDVTWDKATGEFSNFKTVYYRDDSSTV